MTLSALHHVKAQFMHPVVNSLRLQPCRTSTRKCPDVQRRAGQRGIQFNTLGIIRIDNRRLQARPVKQPCLGMPIILHGRVVVEVVLCEVGENGNLDACRIQPSLFNAN